MSRVVAAFLTGAALSAVLLVSLVIRRDGNGAVVSLQPLDGVAGRSISAAPAITRGADEMGGASPSPTPMIAPSSPAPDSASDPDLRIKPSPAPPEIPSNATPAVTPLPQSSDITSDFAPSVTPSPAASEAPARIGPAESRPSPEINLAPARPVRPPLDSAEASKSPTPEISPLPSAAAETDRRKPWVRPPHVAVRPAPVSLPPPRNPSRPRMCAGSLQQ